MRDGARTATLGLARPFQAALWRCGGSRASWLLGGLASPGTQRSGIDSTSPMAFSSSSSRGLFHHIINCAVRVRHHDNVDSLDSTVERIARLLAASSTTCCGGCISGSGGRPNPNRLALRWFFGGSEAPSGTRVHCQHDFIPTRSRPARCTASLVVSPGSRRLSMPHAAVAPRQKLWNPISYSYICGNNSNCYNSGIGTTREGRDAGLALPVRLWRLGLFTLVRAP